MTSKDLDDLEHRLAKGWVIRPDQIRALISAVRFAIDRGHIAGVADKPYCVRCDTHTPCTSRSCPNVPAQPRNAP